LGSHEVHFLYGVLGYFLLHTLLMRPVYLYTISHEMVHAIFSMLFGGVVKSLKVSKKGGKTVTTHTNILVELAPYFTPLYTILLCGLGFLAIRLFELKQWENVFFFCVGLSLTFHVVMTVDFLKIEQPDLIKLGALCSIEIIYLVNLFVIVGIVGWVFPEVSFQEFCVTVFQETRQTYEGLAQQLFFV